MLERRRPATALNGLLFGRDCLDCPDTNPSCSCPSDEQCVITSRVCNACPSASCVKNGSSSSSSGGISGGAVAGAVIGVLVLLSAAVALFLWYRRRQRAEKAAQRALAAPAEPKSDVPARAEAVLSRPDPNEKPASPREEGSASSSVVRMYPVMSDSTINLDPHAQILYSDDSPDGSRIRSSRHGSYTGAGGSGSANPFSDGNSIITTSASTQSTNVIPIALVPHGSSSPGHSHHLHQQNDDGRSTTGTTLTTSTSSSTSASSGAPARPAHSPELGLRFDPHAPSHGHGGHLNLEHVNVSKDSFRPPHAPYASSQASGFSTSNRESVMTSGSFASDMLYEAPQIVTLTNTSRAKAEVVSVNGSVSSSLKPAVSLSRQQPGRSPLAQSSFKPSDAFSVSERSSTHSADDAASGQGQEIEYRRNNTHNNNNPFDDDDDGATPHTGAESPNPLPSTASLAMHGGKDRDIEVADSPRTPRPTSTLTQAASIIGAEIGGATVVRLAGATTGTLGSANSVNRMTSAHLFSPGLSSGNGSAGASGMSVGPGGSRGGGTLQLQQAQALAAARAKAAAQGITTSSSSSSASPKSVSGSGNANTNGIHSRRVSEASCMSAGGDSLLESFTFVPPSPISSRPPRSPLSSASASASASASSPLSSASASASSPLYTSTSTASSPLSASMATTAALPPVPKLPAGLARANEAHAEEVESRRKMLGLSSGGGGGSGGGGVNALEGYEFRIGEPTVGEVSVPTQTSQTTTAQAQAQAQRTTPTGTGTGTGTGLRKLPTSPARPPPSAMANSGDSVSGSVQGQGTGTGLAGRQRASLDTLALTSDLAAFPLSFDANGNGQRRV